MKQSKYLRQVIFGNINPKRQVKIERFLIEKVVNWLLDKNLIAKENIEMVVTDEIIFSLSENDAIKFSKDVKNLTQTIKNELNLDVDIEIFKLVSIENKSFAKEFINNDEKVYELKIAPKIYFAQIYKKYTNQQLNKFD